MIFICSLSSSDSSVIPIRHQNPLEPTSDNSSSPATNQFRLSRVPRRFSVDRFGGHRISGICRRRTPMVSDYRQTSSATGNPSRRWRNKYYYYQSFGNKTTADDARSARHTPTRTRTRRRRGGWIKVCKTIVLACANRKLAVSRCRLPGNWPRRSLPDFHQPRGAPAARALILYRLSSGFYILCAPQTAIF